MRIHLHSALLSFASRRSSPTSAPSTLFFLCKASLSCSAHRCKRISDCRLFFCAICCCCCPFYSMPLISFQIAALLLQHKKETASAENRKNEEKGRSYTYAKNCSICGIKPPNQLIVLPCLLLQQLSQFFVVLFNYLSFSLWRCCCLFFD